MMAHRRKISAVFVLGWVFFFTNINLSLLLSAQGANIKHLKDFDTVSFSCV